MRLETLKTKRQSRKFVGMVDCCRNMWKNHSKVLAPLAASTTKKAKWKWMDEHQKAFHKMKWTILKDVVLSCPDFSQPFDVHVDASHKRSGAVISQHGLPMAFCSQKSNNAQTHPAATEQELLLTVKMSKDFKNILSGHEIHVCTDHKNLTCANFNAKCVMHWHSSIEEFSPELHHEKGKHNEVADAFSRLPFEDSPVTMESLGEICGLDSLADDACPLTHSLLQEEQHKDKSLQDQVTGSAAH